MGRMKDLFMSIREREVDIDDYDFQYQEYLSKGWTQKQSLSSNTQLLSHTANQLSSPFLNKKENDKSK